ncbi:MAG: choice-of-anchor C family protein [Myxococcales bacterium]|nr:choice-of-anchor C family protein [Myxococcales bacterium]
MQQLFSFLVPSRRFVGILLLTIFLPVSPALAMSILNGSFEQGTISDLDPRFETLPAGSGNITSWEIIGLSVDYIGSLWMASDGNRSLDLEGIEANAGGGVQQTFATDIGQMYEVTFDMAGNPSGVSSIKVLNVSAGDNNQNFSFDTVESSTEFMNWDTRMFTFTATSTSTTLAFTAVSPLAGFGAALDNVDVHPVPEPSTVLLLGAALAGLGVYRRCRS